MRPYGDLMAPHKSMSAGRRRWVAAVCVVLVAGLAFGLYWFQPWRLWTNVEVQDALPVVASDVLISSPIATAPVAPATTARPSDSGSTVPTTSSSVPAATSPAPAPVSGTARKSRSATAAPPRAERASSAPIAPSTITSISSATRPTAAPSPAPPLATVLATGRLISHEHDTSGTARIVKLADGRRVLTLENLQTSDGPALHVWLTDAPVIDGEDGWHIFDDGLYTDLGNLKGNIGNQVYPLPADLDLSRYSSVSVWCERFSVSFGAAELETA